MQRKIIDEPIAIRELGELVALDRATNAVHQWKFLPGSPAVARPGFRLRLVVLEEPENPAILPVDERLVEVCRERLRSNFVRATFATGYSELELRDLTDAIEDLIAARIGRALRIHCDADHDDED